MADGRDDSDGPAATGGGGEVTALHDLIAGGVAGSASVVVGHPFDTIKVRMQTSGASPLGAVRDGGARSLFRGMAAPFTAAGGINAIIFASYGSFTRLWEGWLEADAPAAPKGEGGPPPQNTLKVFTCGAAAGTVQAFVICPMEHVKCRLQVQRSAATATAAAATVASTQQPMYKGPIDACLSITRRHGLFRGLYRGMGVTLWRETPAFGMYFATYDAIKSRVESLLDDGGANHAVPSHARAWASSALAGGVAGAFTWAIIYPFDVIKSRIQTGPLDRELQRGMWTVARDIVEERGWRHLFRGLGVTLARAFPVNAIIFPVYELVLVELGDGD